MRSLLVILALIGVGFVVYGEWLDRPRAITIHNDDGRIELVGGVQGMRSSARMPRAAADAATFTCDGRQHCSQMHSCDEATFFVKHCPGVTMDGDNDGLPCEDQWCR